MRMHHLLDIGVVHSAALSATDRAGIVAFCSEAYEEDLGALFDTFAGATHVLGFLGSELASHALWVTRQLQVGTGPLLRTAYVEAVATAVEFRNHGYAADIMRRLATEIQDYDLGALSPFSVDYYVRLGWERWRGPLYIRFDGELLPSPPDDTVMILRLPKTPELDLDALLSAEWRAGELW